MDSSGVPATYDELIAEYFGYVRGLVRILGVREDEDAAQAILLRFFEADRLAMYDPTVVGHGKATNFKAFLRAFVEAKCRHLRDRQGVRDHREPVKCDQPVGDGSSLWVDIYQVPEPDFSGSVLSTQHEQDMVLLIRERLLEIPDRGKRNLLRLFDMMLLQIRTDGTIDRKELSKQYGVSTSVIGSMMSDIRDAISFLQPV